MIMTLKRPYFKEFVFSLFVWMESYSYLAFLKLTIFQHSKLLLTTLQYCDLPKAILQYYILLQPT